MSRELQLSLLLAGKKPKKEEQIEALDQESEEGARVAACACARCELALLQETSSTSGSSLARALNASRTSCGISRARPQSAHNCALQVTQMNYRLKEGLGEAIYELGIQDDGFPQG